MRVAGAGAAELESFAMSSGVRSNAGREIARILSVRCCGNAVSSGTYGLRDFTAPRNAMSISGSRCPSTAIGARSSPKRFVRWAARASERRRGNFETEFLLDPYHQLDRPDRVEELIIIKRQVEVCANLVSFCDRGYQLQHFLREGRTHGQ